MKKETKILGLSVTAFIVLAVIIYVIWKFYPKAKEKVQSITSSTGAKPNTVTTTSQQPQIQYVNVSNNNSSSQKDAKIEALQKALNATKRYNLATDGIFGSQTKTALYKEMQAILKVATDGVFGTKSKEAFKAKYNIEPTDENIINTYLGVSAASNVFAQGSFFGNIFTN
jgi:peptidoglycan hydrolase-like protein with peptidoglycan-binding domain